jgi:type IV secretory pathway VirB9-like protein
MIATKIGGMITAAKQAEQFRRKQDENATYFQKADGKDTLAPVESVAGGQTGRLALKLVCGFKGESDIGPGTAQGRAQMRAASTAAEPLIAHILIKPAVNTGTTNHRLNLLR